MTVRRYIAVIQDPRGYPPNGQHDLAPPEGPAPPELIQVVRADDHDRIVNELVTENAELKAEADEMTKRAQDLWAKLEAIREAA